MKSYVFNKHKVFMGRLHQGQDVLKGLTEYCQSNRIHVGTLKALGAVEQGAIGYYDQNQATYKEILLDQHLEIANLTGNISHKNEDIFLHCHIVLADSNGRCFGGHLIDGNITFACEFEILALDGDIPERILDEATKLMLW